MYLSYKPTNSIQVRKITYQEIEIDATVNLLLNGKQNRT